MPPDERQFLPELEAEVEAELGLTESSDEALDVSPTEWLFDPTDVEREHVGLISVLGAVEELEIDYQLDQTDADRGTRDAEGLDQA